MPAPGTAGPVVRSGRELAVTVSLLLLPLAYYAEVLGASWRYDDALHLVYVQQFAAWQFFFDPHALREFSSAFVTPWNPLVYWVNFRLFGFAAQWSYLGQLLALGVATTLVYRVGRVWWKPLPALIAAAVFACGPPAGAVANELMDSHYAWGGIFSLLATWFYFRPAAAASNRPPWAALLCYSLACLCKEVYVVLPALLWLAAPGRWRACACFAAVALPYFAWRWMVLGHPIGGYPRDPVALGELVGSALALAPLPHRLLGFAAYLIPPLIVALLVLRRLQWRELGLVAAQSVAVLLPLATMWGQMGGAGRYQFSLWLLLSVWCAGLLDRLGRGRMPLATLIAGGLLLLGCVQAGKQYLQEHEASYAHQDAYSRFVLSRPGRVFLLDSQADIYPALVAADALSHALGAAKDSRPETIYDAALLTPSMRQEAYDYDPACRCVARVRQLPRTSESAAPVDFITLPLGSRKLRLARRGQGNIDEVSISGASILIRGWIALPDNTPGRMVTVFGEYMPRRTTVATVSRADVARALQRPELARSGFELSYQYPSVAVAQANLATTCVFGFSFSHGLVAIPGQVNPVCDEYLK